MHVIAAKAVAFKEALEPSFKAYQQQVIENARVMAETLTSVACGSCPAAPKAMCSCSTCAPKGSMARKPKRRWARRTSRSTRTPSRTIRRKPIVTSGIRIGTPAMTTRGFKELEAEKLAHLVADVLDAPNDEAVIARVQSEVAKLTAAFPVYGK
jgi:glycine hydroxymethyltransferase